MRILITGGAGFIGSQLGLRLHRQGHDVVLLDSLRFGHVGNLLHDGRPFGTFLARDIRDPNLAGYFQGVDTVYHFAAISSLPECQVNPREAYDVNVGGTAAVLELARSQSVRRVIFASTSAVYENTKTAVHVETDAVAPDLVYAMTKLAAEQVCAGYARNYGLDIVICRFFNTFGAHQDMTRTNPPFTSYLAREVAFGRKPTLYNKTDVPRDYIFVEDLIDLLGLMQADKGLFNAEVFNVCSGKGYSVPEIVSMVETIAGRPVSPHFADPKTFWGAFASLTSGARPLKPERLEREVFKPVIGSNVKAERSFGWQPKTSMAEGLAHVMRYAQEMVKRGTV